MSAKKWVSVRRWVASTGDLPSYEALGTLYGMTYISKADCQAAIDSMPNWDDEWGNEPEIEPKLEMVEIEEWHL